MSQWNRLAHRWIATALALTACEPSLSPSEMPVIAIRLDSARLTLKSSNVPDFRILRPQIFGPLGVPLSNVPAMWSTVYHQTKGVGILGMGDSAVVFAREIIGDDSVKVSAGGLDALVQVTTSFGEVEPAASCSLFQSLSRGTAATAAITTEDCPVRRNGTIRFGDQFQYATVDGVFRITATPIAGSGSRLDIHPLLSETEQGWDGFAPGETSTVVRILTRAGTKTMRVEESSGGFGAYKVLVEKEEFPFDNCLPVIASLEKYHPFTIPQTGCRNREQLIRFKVPSGEMVRITTTQFDFRPEARLEDGNGFALSIDTALSFTKESYRRSFYYTPSTVAPVNLLSLTVFGGTGTFGIEINRICRRRYQGQMTRDATGESRPFAVELHRPCDGGIPYWDKVAYVDWGESDPLVQRRVWHQYPYFVGSACNPPYAFCLVFPFVVGNWQAYDYWLILDPIHEASLVATLYFGSPPAKIGRGLLHTTSP